MKTIYIYLDINIIVELLCFIKKKLYTNELKTTTINILSK